MAKREKVEPLPDKMVRVEYEVPPTRMICSVWYEDFPESTDAEYKQACQKDCPGAKIRRVDRGITKDKAAAIAFHEDDQPEPRPTRGKGGGKR